MNPKLFAGLMIASAFTSIGSSTPTWPAFSEKISPQLTRTDATPANSRFHASINLDSLAHGQTIAVRCPGVETKRRTVNARIEGRAVAALCSIDDSDACQARVLDEIRTRSDAEHELGDALARDLGGDILAKLVGHGGDARECSVRVGEVFARRDEGHEHARGIRRWRDRCEREIFDRGVVELGERVGQGVEHLTAQLEIFVVASATTRTF